MVGRVGKPTAGGEMGTAERNKTLPTSESQRAVTVIIFGEVTFITSACSRSIQTCVVTCS